MSVTAKVSKSSGDQATETSAAAIVKQVNKVLDDELSSLDSAMRELYSAQ